MMGGDRIRLLSDHYDDGKGSAKKLLAKTGDEGSVQSSGVGSAHAGFAQVKMDSGQVILARHKTMIRIAAR